MTSIADDSYWKRIAQHYDHKGKDDLNYLSSEDGIIVHHHTGLFSDGQDYSVEGEQTIIHELWRSEGRMVELVASMLQPRSGELGLDCGCGRGGSSFILARAHGVRMFGITLSQTQLRFAQDAAEKQGLYSQVEFGIENIYDARRPSQTYDFVWALESTEHMGDRQALFAQFRRVLKPRGRVVVVALTYVQSRLESIRRELDQLNEYYVGQTGSFESYLEAAINNGFALDDIVHLNRETLPYWRLRLRSTYQTGTEPWLIHGLENGGFHYSAMHLVLRN